MAGYLGIDWDHQRLRVVEATIQRGRVNVTRAFVWMEPNDPNPAQAEECGRRLKDHLAAAGIAPAPVLYTVARDRIIFKEVNYPDVPANEVPAIVAFQVAKELSFPPDEAVIDYVPCTLPGANGAKRALVAVLHNQLHAAIQRTLQIAGLRLAVLSPRPFGIVANWRAQVGPLASPSTHGVLVAMESAAEFCAARGDELLFSRTISARGGSQGGDVAAACLPELRRTTAAFASQFASTPLNSIFLTGGTAAGGDILAAGLKLPVSHYDATTDVDPSIMPPEQRAGFAAVLGLMHSRAGNAILPIDFQAPKKTQPPPNRSRYYLYAAILAGILIAGVLVSYSLASSSRDAEIESLQARRASLQKQIAAFGDTEKRLETIQNWANGEMVVLDELYELIACFPDAPGIRITKVEWKPAPQPLIPTTQQRTAQAIKTAATQSQKPIGQITIEATADSSATLEKFRAALAADSHWKLEWEKDTPAQNQARATLKVFRQKLEEYTTVLAPTTNVSAPGGDSGEPRRPNDRRGGFGPGGLRPPGGLQP